jgi:hypothetical protein
MKTLTTVAVVVAGWVVCRVRMVGKTPARRYALLCGYERTLDRLAKRA